MNLIEKIEKNGHLIIISFVALVIIVLIAMDIYSENSEPVIRVNMTLIENNSEQIEIESIDLKLESTIHPSIFEPSVSEPDILEPSISEPDISEHDISSIIGIVTLEGNPLGFGTTKYYGTGRYIFDVGFEGYHPRKNDEIRLSIVIIDKNKYVIGYFVRDLMWR